MEEIINSPSGNISIRINDDKMSAWMYIHKSDVIIDEQEILELLRDSGICNGFQEALDWMSENGFNKDFDKPFPVAICKPSSGKEKIRYLFNPEQSYNPEKDWTFRDLQNWKCCEKGTILADITSDTFSAESLSYNVFGDPAAAQANNDILTSSLGKNVILDDDSNHILSSISGYPYLDNDNKINVIDHLEYRGDLKLVKIPVSLSTKLTVHGSIHRVQISILNDLEVKGNIIASEVYVEGNLSVIGDIIDCQTSGVTVTEDTKVNSISNSLISCKGQLNFNNSISGSRIIGEKQITGNHETSQIYGSQVLTSGSVDVAVLGNAEGSQTEVEITISPFLKERYNQMKRTLIKYTENPKSETEKINQLSKKLVNMEVLLSEDLSAHLTAENKSPKFVKVRNELFKGVYIRILKKSFAIKNNQANVEFIEE